MPRRLLGSRCARTLVACALASVTLRGQVADVSTLMLARVVDADPSVRLEAVRQLSDAFGSELALYALSSLALTDPDAVVREEAIRGIGQNRRDVDMPVLGQALWDPVPAVRKAAVDAIGAIGGESGVAALAVALLDADARLREDAVYALGRIGGEWASELVTRARGDVDPTVRASAAQILAELQQAAALASAADSPALKP